MINVTGSLKDLSGTAVTSGAFVRFWMRGTGGNQPFVAGTALLPANGSTWFQDMKPDANGSISGTLFSTAEVTCGAQTGVIWYGMQIAGGPEVAVSAAADININNPNALSTLPVSVAPTGDTTYLRLDASNSPITGTPAFSSGLKGGNINTTSNGFASVTNPANFSPNFFGTVGTTNPSVPGPNGAVCGLIGEATSLTNSSVTSGIVGVYGGAKRSQGIGGTWGGNVLAETNIAVSTLNPCYAFEADINNNWRDAVSTDLIHGLMVLNGATFKSNIGLLIGKGAGSTKGFVQGIAVTSADAGISIQATDNSLDVQPQSSASSVTGYNARRLQSATSGGNFPFPQMVFNSAVWNGSASVDSVWSFSHAINASGTVTFDSFRIANSSSPTANLAVEIPNRLIIDTNGGGSSIISSTTATSNVVFALPNTATSGNVVVDNATQTLTNKTLTSPILTTPTLGAASGSSLILTAAAPTASASQVSFGNGTATTATAGANGAVPAQVVGYLVINVAGTAAKVPYFAN